MRLSNNTHEEIPTLKLCKTLNFQRISRFEMSASSRRLDEAAHTRGSSGPDASSDEPLWLHVLV